MIIVNFRLTAVRGHELGVQIAKIQHLKFSNLFHAFKLEAVHLQNIQAKTKTDYFDYCGISDS